MTMFNWPRENTSPTFVPSEVDIAVLLGVFPHKDPLSNDLKSRDNVYITTATELRFRVGRFFGYVCVCYAESQLSAGNKYTHTFSRITCILTQLTPTIHEREECNQQRREKTQKTKQATQEAKRHTTNKKKEKKKGRT